MGPARFLISVFFEFCMVFHIGTWNSGPFGCFRGLWAIILPHLLRYRYSEQSEPLGLGLNVQCLSPGLVYGTVNHKCSALHSYPWPSGHQYA